MQIGFLSDDFTPFFLFFWQKLLGKHYSEQPDLMGKIALKYNQTRKQNFSYKI